MAQNATSASLQALTEWWEEMGVEIDHGELKHMSRTGAIMAASATPAASQSQAGQQIQTETVTRRRKVRPDWVSEARDLAAQAKDLPSLRQAIEEFEGSPLKALSNRAAVYDGIIGAPVMIIGEGPGEQEDLQGLPFVGKAGHLLDRMLAAIQLDRKTNTFITNVNFWRPPGNRNPDAEELAVCRPFLDRMIDLGRPALIVATGGVAAKALLNTRTGIMRLRGVQHTYQTPAGTQTELIAMFHPAYLLRRPQDKSLSWRDLLKIRSRLRDMEISL